MTSDLNRPDLDQELNLIQKKFEFGVQCWEENRLNESSEALYQVTEKISSLIEPMAQNYRKALVNHRFSTLETDKETLKTALENTHAMSSSQIQKLVSHCYNHINNLQTEVVRLYPHPPILAPWFKKWKKKIIAFGVFILALLPVMYAHRKSTLKTQGLYGEYFSGINFNKLEQQRQDNIIEFNWGHQSPFPNWRKNEFSVRWTGFLYVPQEGLYEIITHSDDGVRLWIGNKLIIEDWNGHSVKLNRGRVRLTNGYYPLKLEYFEGIKNSAIRLSWKNPGMTRIQIIKGKYLVPLEKHLKPEVPINFLEMIP